VLALRTSIVLTGRIVGLWRWGQTVAVDGSIAGRFDGEEYRAFVECWQCTASRFDPSVNSTTENFEIWKLRTVETRFGGFREYYRPQSIRFTIKNKTGAVFLAIRDLLASGQLAGWSNLGLCRGEKNNSL
jgi:hypothetical protein